MTQDELNDHLLLTIYGIYGADQKALDAINYWLLLGADIHTKNKDHLDAISISARDGKISYIKLLLEKGANIHSTCHQGRTPLHHATNKGRFNSIAFLIDHGANPYLEDINGMTAFDIAFDKHKSIPFDRIFINIANYLKTRMECLSLDKIIKIDDINNGIHF